MALSWLATKTQYFIQWIFDVTYFRTDSCSDELVISKVNQLLTNGSSVSGEPKHLPIFWPVSKATSCHNRDISLHRCVCLKKSSLANSSNKRTSWLEDPKRPLTEETRKETRDSERLPSHTENCLLRVHSVFIYYSGRLPAFIGVIPRSEIEEQILSIVIMNQGDLRAHCIFE